MSRIHLFNVGSEDHISGGYLYNNYLIEELKLLGKQVSAHFLKEDDKLETCFNKKVKVDDVVLIDSLLLVEEADFVLGKRNDFSVYGLIHLPQFFDPEKSERHAEIFQIEKRLFQSIPLIVTSDFIKKEIYKIFEIASKNIDVVDPAVGLFKKKVTFAKYPKKLISVSNVIERKGYHLMIDGLALVNDLDWQLNIYGNTNDTQYFEQLIQKINESGMGDKIHFRGTMNHALVNQKMIDSDLLLNTSLFETYNMILAESLASGLPFLSTKVGAFEKFDSFKGGAFIENFEKETLANSLKKLLTNEGDYKDLFTKNLPFETRTWCTVAEEFLTILS